jgi:chaperonin cofactor prefoldin
MAKGTNAKIKELKGIKPEKITEAELGQLQSNIKTIEKLTNDVGIIEVRKHSLMRAMETIHSRLEVIRVKLEKEYGTDNISLEDGTITYAQTQPENGEVNS